jgi:cysteinyl-tRNA synthetase
MLQAHYRSTLDFSNDALTAAEKGYKRLMAALTMLKDLKSSESSDYNWNELIEELYTAMNDDLNSPVAIASLFDAVRRINSIKEGKESISKTDLNIVTEFLPAFVENVLGLKNEDNTFSNNETKLPSVMDLIIRLREDARFRKDFVTSDTIRDGLKAAGINIKDTKEGTEWTIE